MLTPAVLVTADFIRRFRNPESAFVRLLAGILDLDVATGHSTLPYWSHLQDYFLSAVASKCFTLIVHFSSACSGPRCLTWTWLNWASFKSACLHFNVCAHSCCKVGGLYWIEVTASVQPSQKQHQTFHFIEESESCSHRKYGEFHTNSKIYRFFVFFYFVFSHFCSNTVFFTFLDIIK